MECSDHPLPIRINTEIIPLSPYDLNYINEIQIVNHSGIAILSHYVPTMYPLWSSDPCLGVPADFAYRHKSFFL